MLSIFLVSLLSFLCKCEIFYIPINRVRDSKSLSALVLICCIPRPFSKELSVHYKHYLISSHCICVRIYILLFQLPNDNTAIRSHSKFCKPLMFLQELIKLPIVPLTRLSRHTSFLFTSPQISPFYHPCSRHHIVSLLNPQLCDIKDNLIFRFKCQLLSELCYNRQVSQTL